MAPRRSLTSNGGAFLETHMIIADWAVWPALALMVLAAWRMEQ